MGFVGRGRVEIVDCRDIASVTVAQLPYTRSLFCLTSPRPRPAWREEGKGKTQEIQKGSNELREDPTRSSRLGGPKTCQADVFQAQSEGEGQKDEWDQLSCTYELLRTFPCSQPNLKGSKADSHERIDQASPRDEERRADRYIVPEAKSYGGFHFK